MLPLLPAFFIFRKIYFFLAHAYNAGSVVANLSIYLISLGFVCYHYGASYPVAAGSTGSKSVVLFYFGTGEIGECRVLHRERVTERIVECGVASE